MNMIEATKACFSKYVTFSGRARRAEYWWFVLATVLVSIVLGVIDAVIGFGEFGLLSNIWSLAVFLPSIAAGARRLHDTDRSAWWLLIMLLPLIGWIVLIVFFAQKGTAGANRFGPDPLRGDRAEVFN
jgi:uncharacterized membrane protein YhaH (DUF805 family)